MFSTSTTFLALSALLPLVSAHGWLDRIAIDGQLFQGASAGSTSTASVIRTITDVGPANIASPALACGNGAGPAALTADARPGSKVSFQWVNGEKGPWIHKWGPMNVWMAQCTGTTCDKFDSANAKWFKVAEAGQKVAKKNDWYLDLTTAVSSPTGASHTVTLPKELPVGDYLVRHEMIALHVSPGEFYAGCAQLRIGGSSKALNPGSGSVVSAKPLSALVSATEFATFPGSYKSSDIGIADASFKDNFVYPMPGPKLAAIAVRGAGASSITKALPLGKAGAAAANSPALSSPANALVQVRDAYGADDQVALSSKATVAASSTGTATAATVTVTARPTACASKKRMVKARAAALVDEDDTAKINITEKRSKTAFWSDPSNVRVGMAGAHAARAAGMHAARAEAAGHVRNSRVMRAMVVDA